MCTDFIGINNNQALFIISLLKGGKKSIEILQFCNLRLHSIDINSKKEGRLILCSWFKSQGSTLFVLVCLSIYLKRKSSV